MRIRRILSVFMATLCWYPYVEGNEKSRPHSIGGEYIVEYNTGLALESSEGVFEVGVDFERFVKGTDHHFSLGFSTELSFNEWGKGYFFGPLLGAYYLHFKMFIASGVLTDFESHSLWKTRVGAGYEIILYKSWIFVPTIAVDFLDGHLNPTMALGVACEF